jgi:hypothetical protein
MFSPDSLTGSRFPNTLAMGETPYHALSPFRWMSDADVSSRNPRPGSASSVEAQGLKTWSYSNSPSAVSMSPSFYHW